jgi:hypothetical protein
VFIRSVLLAAAIVVAVVGSASPAYARGHGGSGGSGGGAGHNDSGCYTAVSGDCVDRPTRTGDGSRPPGSTIQCADGSWSFSEHPSSGGTCHGHGGV